VQHTWSAVRSSAGSNPRAAVLAGWPRRRLLALAYILSALLTAFGAMMLTARVASGEPNLGGGLSFADDRGSGDRRRQFERRARGLESR